MKPIVLTGALALLGATTLNAQLSLLPQAGFEQARTSLNYGNGLSARDINGTLKAGLQAGYHLKGGHTPFVRLATSPAATRFAFNNAGDLVSRTATSDLLFRLEAGYQYSSKPISLGKKGAGSKAPVAEATPETVVQRSSCGAVTYRSSCGSKTRASKLASPGNLNMRLQPSLALAYIPSNTESSKQTANGFDHTAAAWKTALVPALGFEFAKGNQRLFTLTAFYTRPLQQTEEAATYGSGTKSFTLPLQSKTSTWGMTFGVPFGFSKATHNRFKNEKREHHKSYRRCGRL
jgi:hypothetical protein